jgi:hypothetical protein
MIGLKSFTSAEATIAGIKLVQKKGQLKMLLTCLFMNNFMHLQPSCAQGSMEISQ